LKLVLIFILWKANASIYKTSLDKESFQQFVLMLVSLSSNKPTKLTMTPNWPWSSTIGGSERTALLSLTMETIRLLCFDHEEAKIQILFWKTGPTFKSWIIYLLAKHKL
jgi:hypothetical protein